MLNLHEYRIVLQFPYEYIIIIIEMNLKRGFLMELRTLRYFLAAAEEENITRAADILHVTQPTLSRQMMDLEKELAQR